MGTSVAAPGTDLEGIRRDVAADGDPAPILGINSYLPDPAGPWGAPRPASR